MASKARLALLLVSVGFLLVLLTLAIVSNTGKAAYVALMILPVAGLLISSGMVKGAVANHCCLRCGGHLNDQLVCEKCREDWTAA